MDEAALIRKAQRGDRAAFATLAECYRDGVYRLCVTMTRNREAALDATQDTLIRAFRHIGSFRAGMPFRPWLMKIAVNRCRTQAAAERARPPEPAREGIRVDEMVERKELHAALGRLVGDLPPEAREAVVLHHMEGLPVETVSRIQGRSAGAVKAILFRARRNLLDSLRKEGLL